MCLYSTHKEPSVARKDIECYKLVFKDGLDYFSAPFFCFTYKFGEEYEEVRFQKTNPDGYINRGFHTYKELEDAVKEFYRDFDADSFVIVKCIIPKGSRYWEGVNYTDRNRKEYCSDKIKIVAWKTNPVQPWNETSHAVTE